MFCMRTTGTRESMIWRGIAGGWGSYTLEESSGASNIVWLHKVYKYNYFLILLMIISSTLSAFPSRINPYRSP